MTTTTSPAAAAATVRAVRHFPALDGLRGVAFLLIFVHHAGPRAAPVMGRAIQNAASGVDVFFVLSGFLVTYLLLVEDGQRRAAGEGGFSLVRFWIRRSLRIWPLYFLGVFLAFVVFPRLPAPWTLGPAAGTAAYGRLVDDHAASAGAFLLNWSVVRHGWPAGGVGPLWSVSVEEQFYVLWPIALALTPPRLRVRLLVAVLVAAVLAKIPVAMQTDDYRVVYVNTFLRADAFMAGAVLAFVAARRGGTLPAPPRGLGVLVLVGAAALAAVPPLWERGPALSSAAYAVLDAVAAALVWTCVAGESAAARVLSARPLRFLGTISYGLYVFHPFAISFALQVVCGDAHGPRSAARFGGVFALALATTFAAAIVSYYGFERWFLRLKDRFSGVAP